MRRHKIRRHSLASLLGLTALISPAILAAKSAPSRHRPNVLVIVADDLGFSDLGAFGGEIRTPNLDQLARSGLRLTNFHTAPACAPTRAMLLTGSDSHRVGLGNVPESMARNQAGQLGYEGYLRPDTATLAERLSANGYRTLFSGKWHLGVEPAQGPHARGFQHSFAMLHCCHDHFGLGVSADPKKLPGYRENGVAVTELPANFYSSRFFAAKLVEQLRASSTGSAKGKPFFAYLAFTAPHSPLQAPAATIAKYRGRYDAGFEELRFDRLARQRRLGIIAPDTAPHRMVDAPRWGDLSPEQKRLSARKMEIYAAMVDELDQAVGQVVQALRGSGELNNTIILFLSENGAEGRDPPDGPRSGTLQTMGAAGTYVNYGPGWAQAATAPFWRFKTFASEGGTRAPAFITGQAVRPGKISDAYLHVTDVVPTVLDLAGVSWKQGRFAGKSVPPIDGLSWAPLLQTSAGVYPATRSVGTELFGSRSLRLGDWKLVDIGDKRWRLFNVLKDPGETIDLSDREPARKAQLVQEWRRYAASVNVVLPDPPLQPTPIKDAE